MVYFISSWQSLIRILFVGTVAYIALVVALRISGKRTLSKMNAFDFIVTIAIGSTLGTLLVQESIGVLQGVLAVCLLIFFQFIITWTSARWPFFAKLIRSEPKMIFYKGQFLKGPMRAERITTEEVYEWIRKKGLSGTEEVESIILETTGDLSIIPLAEQRKDYSAYANVTNLDEVKSKDGS
jgi:uncharacterized membrane protein YcaP (DUF421 family)